MMNEKWHWRFIRLAGEVSNWSKDRSRGVGCVLVGPNKEIRSVGYNGFPRQVNDDIEERHERPAKYLYTEHAERNAIYNAARMGVNLDGCMAYTSLFPCADCSRGLIQSGIKTLVTYQCDMTDPVWKEHFEVSLVLLKEAGVEIIYLEME